MPSESAAKATRRDLRRAMGTHAVTVIDAHDQLLSVLVPATDRLSARVETLERCHTSDRLALTSLTDRLSAQIAARPVTVAQRLRWLLRG